MNRFNLIDNASDSLEHAIKQMKPIGQNNTGNWKRIILGLAHVVELLFKEKLRRIHPAFVFNNIDQFPSNKAFTVSSSKAIKRLQSIGNLKFSKEEVKAIDNARNKRNEIEHYEFSITDTEATTLVGQILSFILKFSESHLELDWKTTHIKGDKWLILTQYTEFYCTLVDEAERKINSEQLHTIECSSCHNNTFSISYEKCMTCGRSEETHECRRCNQPYIFSSCEFEAMDLCPSCERNDAYASANYEKY